MSPFTAVVLICQMSIPPSACTEANAVDVIKTRVETELGCTQGWQEIIARGSLKEGLGTDVYLKTICRHEFPRPKQDPD